MGMKSWHLKRMMLTALVASCFAWGLAAEGAELKKAGVTSDGTDPRVYAYAGIQHFYNAEYEQTIASLKEGLARDPDNLHLQNLLTKTYLVQELDRLGQFRTDLYSKGNTFLKEEKPTPDPRREEAMRQGLERVMSLGEQRLAKDPADADALYALGVAHAMAALHQFAFRRSYLSALKEIDTARKLHEQVIRLNPDFHDANLFPGLYQYVLGSLPGYAKAVALLLGHSGDKNRGIELIQDAMTKGDLATSDATVLLVGIYLREKEYAYARELLEALAVYYPRNPHYLLEVALTYERETNPEAALQVYLLVAQRFETGAPGYSKVSPDRLYLEIGSLRQQLGELGSAMEAYARVCEAKESVSPLQANCLLQRGDIFAAQNRPDQARAAYERVAAMPYQELCQRAQERLRKLASEKLSGPLPQRSSSSKNEKESRRS